MKLKLLVAMVSMVPSWLGVQPPPPPGTDPGPPPDPVQGALVRVRYLTTTYDSSGIVIKGEFYGGGLAPIAEEALGYWAMGTSEYVVIARRTAVVKGRVFYVDTWSIPRANMLGQPLLLAGLPPIPAPTPAPGPVPVPSPAAAVPLKP